MMISILAIPEFEPEIKEGRVINGTMERSHYCLAPQRGFDLQRVMAEMTGEVLKGFASDNMSLIFRFNDRRDSKQLFDDQRFF